MFCKRELEMKYGRELAREKGKAEQESEEERGKFLSTPGCHDYICFLLPHNELPQTVAKIVYIYHLIVSIGQKSRHNFAGFSASGFYQAAVPELAGAMVPHHRLNWGWICFQVPQATDRIHILL